VGTLTGQQVGRRLPPGAIIPERWAPSFRKTGAKSFRAGGRHHPGTGGAIIPHCRATSPGICKILALGSTSDGCACRRWPMNRRIFRSKKEGIDPLSRALCSGPRLRCRDLMLRPKKLVTKSFGRSSAPRSGLWAATRRSGTALTESVVFNAWNSTVVSESQSGAGSIG
jgi:hypothetical protein